MSSGKVKVEGVEKTLANLKRWDEKKRQGVKQALLATGYKVEADAKRADRVPILTARLRDSITTNWSGSGVARVGTDGVGQPDGETGMVVVVGTNVLYAHMQEFGSWGEGPKPTGPMLNAPDRREYEPMKRPDGGFQFLTKSYLTHQNEAVKRIEQVMGKDEHIR